MHRASGGDSPGSPRTPQLEALSRRLNAEVEQLRAENARLSVRGPARPSRGFVRHHWPALRWCAKHSKPLHCMAVNAKLAERYANSTVALRLHYRCVRCTSQQCHACAI